MSPQTATSLRLSRIVKADRDAVFRAWTDPTIMKKWLCPEGLSVAEASTDVKVGGHYRIQMRTPEGKTHTAIGVYRKVEHPSRFVCSWRWEEGHDDMGDTLLTVEFKDLGDATEVVLTHEGFPSPETTTSHEGGWTSILERLEKMLAA